LHEIHDKPNSSVWRKKSPTPEFLAIKIAFSRPERSVSLQPLEPIRHRGLGVTQSLTVIMVDAFTEFKWITIEP
jgi:hypothetical protein